MYLIMGYLLANYKYICIVITGSLLYMYYYRTQYPIILNTINLLVLEVALLYTYIYIYREKRDKKYT